MDLGSLSHQSLRVLSETVRPVAVALALRVCRLGPASSPGWGQEPVSYTHLTLPTIYSV